MLSSAGMTDPLESDVGSNMSNPKVLDTMDPTTID